MKYPNLRAEMARRGYTNAELGKILGVGESAISHKLHGRNSFDIKEVRILCDHFKMTFEELFFDGEG